MQNTFFVHSLGCSKNLVDTEGFAGNLVQNKFSLVHRLSEANYVLLNTCAFIQEACKETDSWINYYSSRKRRYKYKFVVIGCFVEAKRDSLIDLYPDVDHFLGINKVKQLVNILKGYNSQDIVLGGKQFFWGSQYRTRIHAGLPSRYIKISEGCNRKCSFCYIPSIRGRLKSNSSINIVREAGVLVKSGAREINLISQDTTSYGRDLKNGDNIIGLLRKVSNINGLELLRLLYLYPDGVTKALVQEVKNNYKVCNYFDIPVQHISSKILKLMNRAHDEKKIKELLETIKYICPDSALRTTIIVGFPGEGKREFKHLVDFIRQGWFEHIGVFAYSPHPRLRDFSAVIEKEALERKKELYAVQREFVRSNNKRFVGRTQKVLIENFDADFIYGRNQFQAPEVDGQIKFTSKLRHKLGDIVKVKIKSFRDYNLIGEVA
ncbi:MAG: 30S ribosomal protein S12 methylthiotransferase RimO [bacterium]